MSEWMIWLGAAGIFLIIEILTTGFLFFWLGISSFVAFILALLGLPIDIQIVAFALSTSIYLIFIKLLTDKLFPSKTNPTNVNNLVGKTGIVTKDINNLEGTGLVKLNGETWSAISEDEDKIIEEKTKVTITQVKGVKLVVKEV